MNKITAWHKARHQREQAEKYIGLIGKTTTQSTVARREGEAATAGTLTKFAITTEINFQPYDGATNYHRDEAFDEALTKVARRKWTELQAEALELLREKERTAAEAALDEVKEQLKEISEVMAQY